MAVAAWYLQLPPRYECLGGEAVSGIDAQPAQTGRIASSYFVRHGYYGMNNVMQRLV